MTRSEVPYMTRLGPIAFLVVLSSVAAASACCFFKCCYKSASLEGTGDRPPLSETITIVSVAGQTPVMGNIPNPVDSTMPVEVLVDYNVKPTDPELILTDLGPRSDATPKKRGHKHYKAKKVTVIETIRGKVWQATFEIPLGDLTTSENYSLVATDGVVSSSSVTFQTK
jgi:hypothetical protein